MRGWRLAPVAIPLALLLGTGVAGLDFGRHWDERVHVGRVRDLLATGVPKAVYYYYPGLCHRIVLWALAPEVARGLARGTPAPQLLGELERFVGTGTFQLRGRALFLGTTSLGVLWVYLAVLAAGGGVAEAFVAASILATSWEVAYHARWIAPDGVNMQLAALSLLLCVVAERRGDAWSVAAAALPAGLAFGCKYQVGLLLLPVLLLAIRRGVARAAARATLSRVAAASLAFALAFLASTPEAIYDGRKLVADSARQASVYRDALGEARGSPLWGYRTSPGPVHLARNVEYLALVQPSPFAAASLALALLAAAGATSLWRASPRRAVVLLAFPVAYLLFQSTQRLHIVRNLLPLAPFGALLAARGAAALASRGGRHRTLVTAGLALVLAADAAWLAWAAGTVRARGTDRFVRELAARMASQPDAVFLVSPKVAAVLARLPGGAPPNAVRDASAATMVAFYHREGLDANEWPAGRARYVWIGPYEINFSYYPSWPADERILVMPAARARELGVRVLR